MRITILTILSLLSVTANAGTPQFNAKYMKPAVASPVRIVHPTTIQRAPASAATRIAPKPVGAMGAR